jgi:type IV secretory pathway TrbL component
MKKQTHSTAIRLVVPVFGFALALSACQKQEDQAGAEQQPPSLTERAAELQEKAKETAAKTAEKTREAAAEAAQKVGSAVETAGEKTREAGEAISDKALSQPEPMPPKENGSDQ